MEVLKFGGTSVGSAERMKSVAELVNHTGKQIVGLSAMSGTTAHLVKITQALLKKENKTAIQLINVLEPPYRKAVQELYSSPEFVNKGNQLITEHFAFLLSFTQDMFTPNEEKTILAEGELLSTALFQY